jgi:hypothetical protein
MFGRGDSLDDHQPLVRVGPDLGGFPDKLGPIGGLRVGKISESSPTRGAYRNLTATFIAKVH